jgi:hypothetical protein
MKRFAWMLLILINVCAFANEELQSISISKSKVFENASLEFQSGKYESTLEELIKIETRIESLNSGNKQVQGFIKYWKGICFNRLQEFSEAIKHFESSISFGFSPKDINYELGQAYFASEKLTEASLQFRESIKKKFKRAVSLYYLGYITKELGQKSKAYNFFKFIEKLSDEEKKEVLQASEMQIGDMLLEEAEKSKDAFRTIEYKVIPHYEQTLAIDKESALAPVIQEKILKLQKKYDLILFNLRNGRPTLIPPYLLRIAQEFGQDSNVTFSPAETTISKSKQSSGYSKTDLLGRYTFYIEDYLSVSPEIRFNNTYYFNRSPEIYRNDNYLIAPAVRTSFEHTFNKKPAALLLDYDFNEARRDVNAENKLVFNSRSNNVMIGERFNYFSWGESIVRFRYRILDSYLDDSDSTMTSVVYEQIKNFDLNILLFYFSYDRFRVQNNLYNTDSLTFRGDLIMSRVKDWFTPSFGLALTTVDPINARATRGRELLINPNARIAKTFKKNWRANLKFDYQKNNSKDESNFAYSKTIYAFELEYLF